MPRSLLRRLLAPGLLAAALSCTTARPLLVAPRGAEGPLPDTLFAGVSVFDGLHERPFLADVLVRDGRIAAVERPGGIALAEGRPLERVPGERKTLLPGLVDCHVHLGGGDGTPPWDSKVPNVEAQAAALLYAGVTTVLTASRDADFAALARRIEAGEVAGPRLFPTSRALTAEGGHPVPMFKALLPWPVSSLVVRQRVRQLATEEDARAAVDEAAAEGSRFVKAMYDDIPPGSPHLARAVLAAAAARAKEKGLQLVVHVGAPEEAVEAAEAGAALLMHVPWEAPLAPAQVARLKELGVPLVTTSRVPEVLLQATRKDPPLSALEREVMPPGLDQAYARRPDGYEVPGFPPAFFAALPQQQAALAANLRALEAAGVPLLAGTDSGLPLMLHGAALHRELQSLVAAGIAPWRALRMATADAARFLAGPGADFGAIVPGARADLLLVEGDPLAGIAATERIAGVWQDGRRLRRSPQP